LRPGDNETKVPPLFSGSACAPLSRALSSTLTCTTPLTAGVNACDQPAASSMWRPGLKSSREFRA